MLAALMQGYALTAGELDYEARLRSGRRVLCRPCLDWSERRTHLAGSLGAALLARFIALAWVQRYSGSRALHITPAGENGFERLLTS